MAPREQIDSVDRRILALLAQDARIPNNTLAEAVGLAPSSCLNRVRRLVERGVLRGFHADVDLEALERGLEAMITVRLRLHQREHVDAFRDHAISLPETVDVFYVTGSEDFLVHLAVRDQHHLREVIDNQITTRPEIGRTATSLVLEHRRKWTI